VVVHGWVFARVAGVVGKPAMTETRMKGKTDVGASLDPDAHCG